MGFFNLKLKDQSEAALACGSTKWLDQCLQKMNNVIQAAENFQRLFL